MNEYVVTINEKKKNVLVINENTVKTNGSEIEVELSKVNNYLYLLKIDNKTYEITSQKLAGEKYRFGIDGHSFETAVRTKLKENANEVIKNKTAEHHVTKIISPMPGLVLKIFKNVGETIKENEPIVLLEAMKMENEIRSPKNGIVGEIFLKRGSSVEKDAVILTIE